MAPIQRRPHIPPHRAPRPEVPDFIKTLRSLYGGDDDARRIFDRLARYVNKISITTLRRIAADSHVLYPQTFKLFKTLDDLKVGKLIRGRRGGETRFQWDYSPKE